MDRVIPYARRNSADWYDPPDAPPAQWMENNRRWINQQMDDSRHIIDIGPEPGRPRFPEPTSRYYEMERGEILRRDYRNYSQDQQL